MASKKTIIIAGILLLIFIPLLNSVSAGIGIMPAINSFKFEPGKVIQIKFSVFTDSPDERLKMIVGGELGEMLPDMVKFDKEEMIGTGTFTATITMPDKINKPGRQLLAIGAKQIRQSTGGIATSVGVMAAVYIMVPYPGKYAEINFNTKNVNIGEPAIFELQILSRGDESIFTRNKIEISNENGLIETLDLGDRPIPREDEITIKKSLDTTNYKPGDYNATAVVQYESGIVRSSKKLRIGRLYVRIINFSQSIKKKGIQPYQIDIESLWNDDIENVKAEVYLTRENIKALDFVTPSVKLDPWQITSLIGYADTDKLELGKYDAEVKVVYSGNSTIQKGQIKVERESKLIYYLIIAGIALVVLIILAWVVYILIKKKFFGIFSKKKAKKKK
jgi:hypothetical protein